MPTRQGSPHTARAGFTVIEMMLVVAIIGILLAVGFVQLRAPSTRLFANDLKAQLQQAKFEAVKRNAPVAVAWDGGAQSFSTRFDTAASDPCNGATVLAVSESERTSQFSKQQRCSEHRRHGHRRCHY